MATYSLGTAELGTQVNMSGLNQGLSDAETLTKGKLESVANSGMGIFQSVFVVGLGNLVAQGVSALTGAVTGLFHTMIEEASAAERTQAQLGAVLESTGGKAGLSAAEINEMASGIQRLTPVSDDAVVAGQNMLLTFTNIGKDVFPQATMTMVDMATAMNGGATPSAEQLSKTAIMLGKALNDPVTGASALRKVGVALTEQQIEQIKAHNGVGDAMAAQKIILDELAVEFGGSAAAAAKTYSGQMEMLQNTFLDVAENAGGSLLPAMQNLTGVLMDPAIVSAMQGVADVLAGALAWGINTVADIIPKLVEGWLMIEPAVSAAWDILQGVGQVFVDLANEAGGWGTNIIDQLASGIMAGAQIVMDVLGSIGGMIAGLLMPGSPPKLLPDLDKWGTGAINAYMEGWGKADFTVFGGLSDAIKSQLDSIAKVTGDKDMGVASMVLGSQEAIARAINEVHTMGDVSEQTFQDIITAAGPAGEQVAGLARSYIDLERTTQDVAQAQSELNQITDEYKNKLSPLNAELKGLQNQKQDIQDAIRLQKLQEEIADAKTTDQERELARIEILELQKKQQIRSVEQERDVSVDAAKVKLEAAKSTQEVAQAQVDQQKSLLDVQKKQNDTIAAQMKAMESASKAMGGAAAATQANVAQNMKLATVAQDVATTVSTVNTRVTETAAAIRGFLAPAITFVQGQVASLAQAFKADGFAGLLSQLTTLGSRIISWLATTDVAIIKQLVAWGQAFVSWVAPFLPGLLAELGKLGSQLLNWLVAREIAHARLLLEWGRAFIAWVAPIIPPMLAELAKLASQFIAWIAAQASPIIQRLLVWGQQFLAWVLPQINPMLSQLGQLATQFINWLAAQVAPIVAKLGMWANSFIAWIAPMVVTFLQQWPGFLSRFLDWVARAAVPILQQLGLWAVQFIAWIVPMIPGMLRAAAGILAALVIFIAETAVVLIAKLVQWAEAFYTWVQREVVPKLPGALGEILKTLATWSINTKQWIDEQMAKLGKALVDGIKQGVQDAWGSFMGWLHDQMQKIPEPIRNALGIESPSKVMAALVGQPIVQGIVQGIYQAYPLLEKAVTGLVDKVEGPMQAMADFAHQAMADALAAGVSTTRQAVSNLDALMQIVTQAQQAKEQADAAWAAAYAAMEKAKSDGDAAIAAAQAAVDQANSILANAKNADEIAAAQAEVDKANEALQKARDDAAKAIADAQTAYNDADAKRREAQTAYASAMYTQQQARVALAEAEAQAAEISKTNAQAGADYLAMRSQQIFELALLEQQQRDAVQAGNTGLADALGQKITLVKAAQAAEIAQYQQHAQDIITAIQQQVANIAEQGRNAGDSFIKGMIDGMVAQAASLSTAMNEAVQGALDALKRYLGIASPSRLFAVNIGEPIAEGMAIGVQAKAMLLADSTSKVAQASINSASSTINNFNLNANYRHQSEQSLRDDIVMLSMMKGRK